MALAVKRVFGLSDCSITTLPQPDLFTKLRGLMAQAA